MINLTAEDLNQKYWGKCKSIREIAQEANLGYGTIRRKMIFFGIKRRTRIEGLRKTQPLKLDFTMTPNLAYILGVCYGDGSICKYYDRGCKGYRHVISLEVVREKKIKIAVEFKKALENIGFNPNFSIYSQKGAYRVRQYSEEFYHWFKALSSDDLRKMLSRNYYMNAFVRGFYECDGCLCRLHDKNAPHLLKYQLSMANTNLEILLFIKDYLEKVGISLGISKRTNSNPKLWKDIYLLCTGSKEKITRFLETINPTIKNKIETPSTNRRLPINQGCPHIQALAERARREKT